MNDRGSVDELIERLRVRVADPKRRTDAPQSISFSGPGGTMTTQFNTIGGLLMGRPGSTSNPNVPEALPAPASVAALDTAQQRLGAPLPYSLRRLYAEIADGGFGPGGGLLSIERAIEAWLEVTREPFLPKGYPWPVELLPIVDAEPGYDCVDLRTGRVVGWDPEGLSERSGEKAWQKSFSEAAPSLEAWLREWVERRPAHEALQERINNSMVEEARKARTRIAAMSPEERRAMGLPEVGWEKVVWGGIGLDG
jgi:SMI1 / KNR4 family (SUKH-1)